MTNIEKYLELEKELKDALWREDAELADRIENEMFSIPLSEEELAML